MNATGLYVLKINVGFNYKYVKGIIQLFNIAKKVLTQRIMGDRDILTLSLWFQSSFGAKNSHFSQ